MRNDAPDIRSIEADNAPLRPCLSPKLPQNSAPTGLRMNDSANTPKVCINATVRSDAGKNTVAIVVAKYEYDA